MDAVYFPLKLNSEEITKSPGLVNQEVARPISWFFNTVPERWSDSERRGLPVPSRRVLKRPRTVFHPSRGTFHLEPRERLRWSTRRWQRTTWRQSGPEWGSGECSFQAGGPCPDLKCGQDRHLHQLLVLCHAVYVRLLPAHNRTWEEGESEQHGHSLPSVLARVPGCVQAHGQSKRGQSPDDSQWAEQLSKHVDVTSGAGRQQRQHQGGVHILQVRAHWSLAAKVTHRVARVIPRLLRTVLDTKRLCGRPRRKLTSWCWKCWRTRWWWPPWTSWRRCRAKNRSNELRRSLVTASRLT